MSTITIEMVDGFVEVGWPNTRRLAYRIAPAELTILALIS